MTPLRRTKLGSAAFAATLVMWIASGTAAPQRDVVTTSSGQQLRIEPVTTNFRTIWDMVWAPDGEMWVTERGGRVSRIDVATGRVTPVGEIDVLERGESGLMGMAFHPDFPREPRVCLAQSFGAEGGIRNRLIGCATRAAASACPRRSSTTSRAEGITMGRGSPSAETACST